MNILLTGSNGFLGRCIFNEIENNNKVFTLNRTNSDYNVDLESSRIHFDVNFDLIIHSAGKAHNLPNNIFESNKLFESNVNLTKNLIYSLQQSRLPGYFIYISSVSVYGLVTGELVKEDQPLLAKDAYGKSKIISEQIILEWCDKNNIICTILRLPLLIGKNPPGNLKNMIKAIKLNYYFNISGGKAKKSMVYVIDVAQIILRIYKIGGIYNLTDGYNPSFYELSKKISNYFGIKFIGNLPKLIAILLSLIGDLFGNKFPINSLKLSKMSATLTFDDKKARNTFNWKPTPILNLSKDSLI